MPNFCGVAIADKQRMLIEAQTAYHQLSIGQSVVSIRDANGDQVTYTPATATQLKQYIAELEGATFASSPIPRPLGFIF